MQKTLLFSLIILSAALTSCSKQLTYFTDGLYKDFRWSEQELKEIQFYVSDDIVLIKAENLDRAHIENGQIKIKDQRKVDQVIIRKGTPGTLVFSPKNNRFAVSFDKDPEKYLMFGPHEKAKGRYVLLAKKWKRKDGLITYGGQEYHTGSKSAYAALMVDIKKAKKSVKETNTASGRTIGG